MSDDKKTPRTNLSAPHGGVIDDHSHPEATVFNNAPETVMGRPAAPDGNFMKSGSQAAGMVERVKGLFIREAAHGSSPGIGASSIPTPSTSSHASRNCSVCHTRITGKAFKIGENRFACNRCFNQK